MKRIIFIFSALLFALSHYAQITTSNPVFFSQETPNVEIIFDASLGTQGLKDFTGEVYAHTGVTIGGNKWRYAPSWGDNAEKYKLTSLGNNKWKLVLSPNIKEYYGLGSGEEAAELAFVFRSADTTKEGKDEGGVDIFLSIPGDGLQILFQNPINNTFLSQDTTLSVQFTSSEIANLTLFVDNEEKQTVADASELTYSYTFSRSGSYQFVAKAENEATTVFDTIHVLVPSATSNETKPENLKDGINYIDNTTVGLVLYAPRKENVFVLGDFNDWTYSTDYQMKRDGDYWWIEIHNLNPQTLYAFQYAVDNGSILTSDAYTELVLDPWNDRYIRSSIFPNLKAYPEGKADGLVATFQIQKAEYEWEIPNFEMPSQENMVIYEMLLRDFTTEKSLQAAIEKLDYLDTLGVTAIELMPIQEFDGNLSWGYNPNHFFAPDKAYGMPEMYKKFIDECHKRGMAVILDMVFNHATGSHPFAKLYWNGATNKTAPDNPWFNVDAPHPYSVFHDFNHEFDKTREYFKEVLQYWIREYKIDGYRMDLTKGFTQKNSTESTASTYDQSRIDILIEYYNAAKEVKPDIMFILEHFCEDREERVLANEGMYLWRNINNAFSQVAMGYQSSSAFGGLITDPRKWVGYAESHDEERNFYKAKTWGLNEIATDSVVRFSRIPANIAFVVLTPGPKMIWQFGELGYDYPIDYNGRTGEKPVVWHWLENPDRRKAYVNSAKAINLRKQFPTAFSEGTFVYNIAQSDWSSGRKISLSHNDLNMIAIANFQPERELEIIPNFTKSGVWYELISGAELNIQQMDTTLNVAAGKLYVFTDRKIELPQELSAFENSNEFLYDPQDKLTVTSFVREKIVIHTKSKIEEVLIHDLRGNEIKRDTSGHSEIDATGLSTGMYIIKINTSSGKMSQKILKL